LEQIAKSEVMTPEEQINTYRDIIKDAKAENEKLKAELADLQKQLAGGSASTSSSMDSMDDSAVEEASEPEAAPAPAPKAKKKAAKKKGKKK
jgi:cell division septum initiation protein DivIVA